MAAQSPTIQLLLEFENYLNKRKLATNKKVILDYRETKLAFTRKQLIVLKFISLGYSNLKIASNLSQSENSIKLFVFRLIKYISDSLNENIDRFSIIVIAQELKLDKHLSE